MAARPGLPAIWPTVPGAVNGIVSLDPRVIQCQECGAMDDAGSVGTSTKAPNMVHLLSSMHFHPGTWSGGQTDNPRLCRSCRLARNCECHACREERRGA